MSDGKATTVFLQNSPLAAKPQASDEAVIVMLHPPGPNLGRRMPLVNQEYVVGRVAEADVVIEADSVSRRHGRFLRVDGAWNVEDMGSTNGTFVNDERITRRPLRDGDLVRFGGAIVKFLTGANIESAYHEEIYKMSILDGLTGIHNKRYLLEFLEREVAGSLRYNMPLSLVMFDIDFFKKVNDTHGHLAGDAVLKEVSRRIKTRIRREDLFARYGGEEFCCILTKTLRDGALLFADALRQIIAREPFAHENLQLQVTVSLGVAELSQIQPQTGEELIRRADENLYSAKHAGRNRVVG
jgi:diguanylate cyclase (GGDEF)-like protein